MGIYVRNDGSTGRNFKWVHTKNIHCTNNTFGWRIAQNSANRNTRRCGSYLLLTRPALPRTQISVLLFCLKCSKGSSPSSSISGWSFLQGEGEGYAGSLPVCDTYFY